MKLATEEDQQGHPHLPKDAELPIPFYVRWGRTLWAFLKSKTGITLSLAVFTFLTLGFILSADYFAVVKIQENDISHQDVFAPRDMQVVDEASAQLKRKQAMEAVLPLYQPADPINQSVHQDAIALFTGLQALSTDTTASEDERHKRFTELLGESPKAEALYNSLFHEGKKSPAWDHIHHLTSLTLDRILAIGLSTSDYFDKRSDIIHQALINQEMTPRDLQLIEFLTDTLLKPNRVVDEKAWQQAKQEAAEKIIPDILTYRQGQKVLERGELITASKIKALETMGKSVKGINWLACLGVYLLTAIALGVLWGYLYVYESRQFFKPKYAALLCVLMTLTVLMFKVADDNFFPPVALPLAGFALTVSIFTHPRVGIIATTLLLFMVGLCLKLELSLLVVLLLGSLMGIFTLSRKMNFRDRGQLTLAGFYAGVSNALLILTVHLLNVTPTLGNPWDNLLMEMGWGLGMGGIGSGVLTAGSLPYLESLFRLVTPFTLMELGNHDQPLLKRMQFEAPGTFHHSLMVASLAEAAAESIGANSLLTRVGCLYHDIGKMKRPLFFIENQAYFGVENPHDRLTPRLSKMVVTAHPRDSIEMAHQYHLPEALMHFMTEHHGTLMAGYFYNQACQEEGVENVNKSQFRYPGPKPRSRETAIVMLADACESAVRALKNPTVSQIEERIDKIIKQRIDDGQFDNCPITFKDITVVKETFVRVLRGIQHNRIEYQQNMLRELGRKVPLPDIQQLASLTRPDHLRPESLKKVSGVSQYDLEGVPFETPPAKPDASPEQPTPE